MSEEPVDLQLILKELRELKALVKQDLDLDRRDLELDTAEVALEQNIAQEERVIEEGERRIEEKAQLLASDLSGMRYVSLDVWKRMVWDTCDQKTSKPSEREITYACAIFGGPCKFELCPKNISRQK